MLSILSSQLCKIFQNTLILLFLFTSVDLASAQIFTPSERPNSLYKIAVGISGPAGIVKRNVQLWVAAKYGNSVVVIQPEGRFDTAIGTERCGVIFCFPVGIAVDSKGFIYVGDTHHAIVRKFLGASVITVAGRTYACGSENAIYGHSLCHPAGIAIDSNDDLYVLDANLHIVRKVTFSTGEIKTIAGNNTCGSADGNGTNASFCQSRGIAIDAENSLYVADTGNSTIRKITPEGVVTTVAGMAGICGALDGGRLADGTSSAQFCRPTGIAFDKLTGNLYIADTDNYTIRKITPDGQVTTVAGRGINKTVPGPLPGTIAEPRGIAVIGQNQLAVTTADNEVLGINF